MITTPEQADELLGPGSAMASRVKFQLARIDTRPDKTALTADGKRPPKCSKCGFVGGRSTGCGTAHGPLSAGPVTSAPPVRRESTAKPLTAIAAPKRPTYSPTEIAEAKARSKERIARIASRSEVVKPAAIAAEPELAYDPDNLRPGLADPNAHYDLPVPSSSWDSAGFPRGRGSE